MIAFRLPPKCRATARIGPARFFDVNAAERQGTVNECPFRRDDG